MENFIFCVIWFTLNSGNDEKILQNKSHIIRWQVLLEYTPASF